ncbi:MAG: hypothetical protein FWC19_05790 [Treponema sp.]|nr:hypothetical protein [Treponema sp.]MCL2272300.1 hypothetical protein [Treponema sp.]
MKLKIIIPRKDHEVYFIMPPEGFKLRDTQNMIYDKLNELHPGFTAASCIDIKLFEFNKTRWFMVTVMAGETLAEYQIIHKKAILYTNTSIMANTKNFTINAPERIDDELIGFDVRRNEPVSIPAETVSISNNQIFAGRIEKIPSMHGVFNRRKPKLIIAVASVFILLLVFLSLIFTSVKTSENTVIVVPDREENQLDEKALLPTAFAVLADIAELFLMENGVIERWQYNLANNSEVTVQCNGISAFTAVAIFEHIKYLTLDDIQNINYIEGKPATTIVLRAKHDVYSTPVSYAFTGQEGIFIAAEELTGLFINQNIIINSEIFPSTGNRYMTYTIIYTANEERLINSIDIMEEICNKYPLFIRSFDIAASRERREFTITCAFSYNEALDETAVVPNDKKQKIPSAFGYKPVSYSTYSFIAEQVPEKTSLIGTIKDSNNHTVFYHDSEGKIRIRSSW